MCLAHEPLHVDEIRNQTELPIEKVSATLALMELKGMVRQVGGMNYVAVREEQSDYYTFRMMEMEHTYAVIMAGGGGTRLWPVSRKETPKTACCLLLGKETLFQSTVNRLENLFPPERILVVTVAEQAREMQKQVPAIPEENYLIEPAAAWDRFCGSIGGCRTAEA